MPELPEAETIVRDLRSRVIGSTVKSVRVAKPDVLCEAPASFSRKLRGRTLQSIDRRAKNLVFRFDGDRTLVVNLGMTGRVVASDAKRAAELRHIAVRLDLQDGRALLYDDSRRFGRLELFDGSEWAERQSRIGPEPLSDDFTAQYLFTVLKSSRMPLRNWLLDQSKVAGVGNIYANEALFRAGIRPQRRANTITRDAAARLRETIRDVLAQAIEARGTTLNDYRDGSGEEGQFEPLLQVYARDGVACQKCGSIIKRIVISNRSAFYCPRCQK